MSARPTASARDLDDEPFDRDEYARWLAWRLERPIAAGGAWLTEAEATVAALLLDELTGVYPGEPLGALARHLAISLSEKAWSAPAE